MNRLTQANATKQDCHPYENRLTSVPVAHDYLAPLHLKPDGAHQSERVAFSTTPG